MSNKLKVIDRPTFIMLVGLPAYGKTTWIKAQSDRWNSADQRYIVASTDQYIEQYALDEMKTYNEVFADTIKSATRFMNESVRIAVAEGFNIIWDQTNLTIKSRASKLAMIPTHYRRECVVLQCDTKEEWFRRLESRIGKTIPPHVLNNMLKSYQIPKIEEGFDDISYVTT